MANEKAQFSPHVLTFPLPLQGPLNCMLKLAEIICINNIKVTFLNTQHIQQRLFNSTNTQIYFKKYPNFRFKTILDGLPEENPRTVDQFPDVIRSMEEVGPPIFEQIVKSGKAPISCIIAEGILNFPISIAKKIGIPFLCFDTLSPCAIWTHLSLPKLIKSGELPFKDDKLDEMIRNAVGVEGIIRRRDLPSFCRSSDVINHPEAQLIFREINNIPKSQASFSTLFNIVVKSHVCL